MNNFWIRAINKLRLLKYFNIRGNITLNGMQFKIPVLGKTGFTNLFMSEPWMVDLLKIILPVEEKLFVDVGVNIGQTLLKLRSVSDQMEYFGFEPNPQCINYTNRLIEENGFEKTKLIPAGVSDNTGLTELKFFSASTTDSSASIIKEFRSTHKVYRKAYIPLFAFGDMEKAINLGKVSVLKIDVEGAELNVLKSMYNLLEQNKPIILIEILPINAYHDDNDIGIEKQKEIQQLLKHLEYSMFRVIKENEVLLDLEEISDLGTHSDLNKCEYVMVPDEKKEQLAASLQNWKKAN